MAGSASSVVPGQALKCEALRFFKPNWPLGHTDTARGAIRSVACSELLLALSTVALK
jgi:hypothetical protein